MYNVYGHITLKPPVLVRSLKLSNVERRQYLDGWPPGNTPCCRPFVIVGRMGRKCTIKLYYQQLPLQCFKNCIEVSDCHTHTGLFEPELPLHTGIRIKIAMKLKTHSQKEIAPGEARTHGLQIMRLTRCLLHYGGVMGTWAKGLSIQILLSLHWSDTNYHWNLFPP